MDSRGKQNTFIDGRASADQLGTAAQFGFQVNDEEIDRRAADRKIGLMHK